METHEYYMRIAMREAGIASENNDVPVGCVVVHYASLPATDKGRIIGKAHNQVELLKDPTAHAEILAITQAAAAIGDWRLLNTVMYITKEPCIMCAGAIVLSRIPTVIYGARDVQRGSVSLFNLLDDNRLNHRCKVISGILEPECSSLLKTFFAKQRSA